MIETLAQDEKLRLLKFLCAFAWADLEIADRERGLVRALVAKMGLDGAAAEQVEGWLDHPPSEEELDPYEIPDEHRRLFLDAALEMVDADGVLDTMEIENFAIFQALMTDGLDPYEE